MGLITHVVLLIHLHVHLLLFEVDHGFPETCQSLPQYWDVPLGSLSLVLICRFALFLETSNGLVYLDYGAVDDINLAGDLLEVLIL